MIERSSLAPVFHGCRAPPPVDFGQLLAAGFTRSLTGVNLQIQMVPAGVVPCLEASAQIPRLLT
jgi:hypothetical protein